jgi:hypothetical protein
MARNRRILHIPMEWMKYRLKYRTKKVSHLSSLWQLKK